MKIIEQSNLPPETKTIKQVVELPEYCCYDQQQAIELPEFEYIVKQL